MRIIGNKNRITNLIIKGVAFVLIFFCCFYILQVLFQPKWLEPYQPTAAWDEYESLAEDTVDVFFMGTSQVYSAIDPMYLYNKTGITSYVLAAGGLRLDLAYAALQEALKTQTPKVIFLDMSPIRYSKSKDEESLHSLLDQLPFSFSKISYVLRCDNNDLTVMEGLFPFFRYHFRWEQLSETDFQYLLGRTDRTYMRGHLLSYKIVGGDTWKFYSEDDMETYEIPLMPRKYLEEIVNLCNKEGIDLILFKVPSLSWKQNWSKASEDFAEEYDLFYWEMNYEIDEMNIDPEFDFRDSAVHMNQYGAEKVTSFIGSFLQNNYSLDDQRGSNDRWDDDLKLYFEEIGYR